MNRTAKTHDVYALPGKHKITRQPASPTAAARSVGEVIYYVRTTDNLIKIGWTRNIANRLSNFGGWQRLLAITPGTYGDEQALHQQFHEHVARGREYYHPTPGLLEHINAIRDSSGVPPLRW